MKRLLRNKREIVRDRKRVWDWIGLAMTAYTALSGIVLWLSIVRGDLSVILEDPLFTLSPVLVACPISVLICFSVYIAPALSWIVALLPLIGWLLLRKGSRPGRVLVIVVMTISLLSAGVFFILGSAAGMMSVLFLSLPNVVVPILTFNAMTIAAPAESASSAEASAAGPTPVEDAPAFDPSALPPS